MKKFIIIAVLFCLSAITFKTEAEEIKDKDFKEFFKEFQEELKQGKGHIDFNQYIDYSSIKKQSKSVKDFVDNHFKAYVWFTSAVYEHYECILKLSPLNKYYVEDDSFYIERWSVNKMKNNRYSLNYLFMGDDDYRWSAECIFAKIDNGWHKWSIIDFNLSYHAAQ